MAARKKAPEGALPVEKALLPQDQPERFRLGEMGSLGLNVFNGVTQDELKKELNWPNSLNIFKEMSTHSTVNAPLTLYENIISGAVWSFKPPPDPTPEEKRQADIVNSMLTDMDQSFPETIRDILSSTVFGFSVHEKVFRKRYHSNGSMYDDGVIGWKKLPIRAQESIQKFIFSEDGNEIIGVKQNLTNLNDPYNRFVKRLSSEVVLPRSKFLLFRTGKHRGDPFGKSPLRDAYLAWRFLTALEDMEATGVAKDLTGLPVLFLPAQYLAVDAPPEVQAVRQYYENAMRNLQMNQQSAMILPQMIDPDSKQPMFKLELLSVDGKKNFDITKIKEYYKSLIFISLFADVLSMGTTTTGSFALGSIKNSLSGAYAERLISNITEVIQNDLIKQTYLLNQQFNGWPVVRMGVLDYDGLDNTDTETFSKMIQRAASVGLVEVDRAVLNAVRKEIGVDLLPEDMAPQTNILSGNSSRAGDGMVSAGEGTANGVLGTDTSSDNLDNAA